MAKQYLANLRNNLPKHPTKLTESTLLEEEALFEFFLPKDTYFNECYDFLLYFVLLGSVLHSPDSSLAAKGFSFFPISR